MKRVKPQLNDYVISKMETILIELGEVNSCGDRDELNLLMVSIKDEVDNVLRVVNKYTKRNDGSDLPF